jgi:hypothetical protein
MSDLEIVLSRIDGTISVLDECEKINRETMEDITGAIEVNKWVEGKADAYASAIEIVRDLRKQVELLSWRSK